MWASLYLYIFYIEEYKNKLNLHHRLKLSLNLKVYHICKCISYIYIFQSIASRFININLKKHRFSCN